MRIIKFIMAVMLLTTGVYAAKNQAFDQWLGDVKAAKKAIKTLSPDELMEWNKSEKDFILVDVRDSAEVLAGRIEANSFKKMPRGLIDPMVMKGNALQQDQTIVVYCKAGTRGALVVNMLQKYGFKNIYNLKGGIQGWMKAGLPIVNELGTFKTVPYELTGCGIE